MTKRISREWFRLVGVGVFLQNDAQIAIMEIGDGNVLAQMGDNRQIARTTALSIPEIFVAAGAGKRASLAIPFASRQNSACGSYAAMAIGVGHRVAVRNKIPIE